MNSYFWLVILIIMLFATWFSLVESLSGINKSLKEISKKYQDGKKEIG